MTWLRLPVGPSGRSSKSPLCIQCLASASSACGGRITEHVDNVRISILSVQAGSGPVESKIPANLRANFSTHYLSQEVDGRTRKEASPSLDS